MKRLAWPWPSEVAAGDTRASRKRHPELQRVQAAYFMTVVEFDF